jgi:CRISPR-associated protein Cmr2
MSQNLFLFTVGPVQSFISNARKTQDLYAGSFILSYLCRTGMDKIREYTNEIIFPDPTNIYVPNRFLAIVNETDQMVLQQIGEIVETAVRQKFNDMGEIILQRLGITDKPQEFKKQIERYLEIYWVFMPFDEKNYSDCYNAIGFKLGSVKTIRCFKQLEEGPGRKCSIDGEHNALFYKNIDKEKAFITNMAIELKNISDKYLEDGEALGAISFVKRCVDKYFETIGIDYDSDFESTSRIALADALERLKKVNPDYKDLDECRFDSNLVYELKSNQIKPEDAKDLKAKEIYETLESNEIEYSPYYAIMLFDGDNMGEWYCGNNLRDNVSLKKFQSELSKKLGRFAEEIRKEVLVLPKGKPVYTGGEDFLGFVNLNYLMEVMKELRERFARIELSVFSDKKLTFSAGIAIAHFKTPLAEVLKWARRMEKEAKKRDNNKDAFGIAVLKHSGEVEKTVLPWKIEEEIWTTKLVQSCLKFLKEGKFSSNFIIKIDAEFSKMMIDDDLISEKISDPDSIFETELFRLLKRSCEIEGKDESKIREINRFKDTLKHLRIGSRELANFISALRIIRFLDKEVKYLNAH